jgi:hypothetical protein
MKKPPDPPDPHDRHGFPAELIRQAVWLYHVFSLRFRDVERLWAERGVTSPRSINVTVPVRLTRFRCAGCSGIETGVGWPSHCGSTPELEQIQAHFSAPMPYRVAAEVLEQVFPVDAGKDPETLPRHRFRSPTENVSIVIRTGFATS